MLEVSHIMGEVSYHVGGFTYLGGRFIKRLFYLNLYIVYMILPLMTVKTLPVLRVYPVLLTSSFMIDYQGMYI